MKNIYQKIKQTAKKYTLPVIIAGNMALGGCSKKYEIDNSIVQMGPFSTSPLKEKRSDGTKIKYCFEGNLEDNVSKVRIMASDEPSSYVIWWSKDSNVIEAANKRVKYLFHKIDSLENVEKEIAIKKINNLEKELK